MTLSFLPNEAEATFNDQAEPDAVDFQILLLGFQQTGVVSGCEVTESAPVGMTIDVASGEVLLAEALVSVSAQADKTIAVPDATFGRFDLVTINSGGTAIVTTGTPAENPSLPSIPANSIPLCGVFIPADGYAGSQLTGQTKTVDSDASSVTFNLPSGAVTGDDIILLVSNTSDRSINTFNAGDTDWTVIQHLIEPPVKLDVVARTLTSSDSKTTVTANTSGTGNIYCFAYIAKGVDLTDSSVATTDQFTFHQFFVDLDSGNTDPKYWIGIATKNEIGMAEQSFSWDYSTIQVHDETQSSPAQSILISGQASSDQTKYQLDTDGPPHWPYFLKSNNEQLAAIAVEFAAVDFVSDNQINDKRVLMPPSPLISHQVIATDDDDFTIVTIPTGFKALRLTLKLRSGTAASEAPELRFGRGGVIDTGASDYRRKMTNYGTNTTSTGWGDVDHLPLERAGVVPILTEANNIWSSHSVDIMGHDDLFETAMQAHAGGDGVNDRYSVQIGYHKFEAIIDRLEVTGAAGNGWAEGSTLTLVGF